MRARAGKTGYSRSGMEADTTNRGSTPALLAVLTLPLLHAGCWMGASVGAPEDGGDDDDSGGITDPDTGTAGQWLLEELDSPTAKNLSDVWGSARDDVWAVGENGVILRYDGAAWSLVDTSSLPIQQDLFGVSGRSADDVVAVGANGHGIAWDGAGWSILLFWPWAGGPFPNLRSVCQGNDGRSWTVADDGTWVNFDAGSGVSDQLPGGIGLFGATCIPGGDAYAVGHDHAAFASSVIYRLGAQDWSVEPMAHQPIDNMYAVTGDPGSGFWAAGFVDGQGSSVYRLIDDGWETWETSPHEIMDLHADAQAGLWAAGNTTDDLSLGVVQAWQGGGPIFEQELQSTTHLRGIWVSPDGEPREIHAVGKGGALVRITWQAW
jgi:hypothetical protein